MRILQSSKILIGAMKELKKQKKGKSGYYLNGSKQSSHSS